PLCEGSLELRLDGALRVAYQPVAMFACQAHTLFASGGDVDGHGLWRQIIELGDLERVVLPLVVDHVARPEFADDRYRLSEPLGTLRVGVPLACGCFFVYSLAGAHAEEDAARIEQSQRSEAL